MITTLAIEGFRSLRHLVMPLGRLTVISGANGVGKSSVYRSLRLLSEVGQSGAIAALAREGGVQSMLWAGPEAGAAAAKRAGHPVQGTVRKDVVALKLGYAGTEFGYAVDFGLPTDQCTMFSRDPEIKAESVFSGAVLRPATALSERRNGAVRVRDARGEWVAHDYRLRPIESMVAAFADPGLAPELLTVREGLGSWRFYDHFRTDPDAPVRQAQLGTNTPVLSHSGADLAAAIQTIRERGDRTLLDRTIEQAFDGASVRVQSRDGLFSLVMEQPGLLRPLETHELSDGTLRFLMLVAALLSPTPPSLLVLNEPETSLHPRLLEPLAQLVEAAAQLTQIVVVSHASALVDGLVRGGANEVHLIKRDGETVIEGQGMLDEPPWSWPKR
ncbi:AAA family ATPase [Salinibacterium sp. NK8237]|uniref:AAA family ATPase n=1 Tax=Salinibacterium sp. NK8237 TaxID=2792038 RepID=UPI0018CFDD12|nr:AAA family ATPase [Salinibacterium sp. NK8237]MBH0130152.1 AAA family ATPase [Salinibacterium sp. NK8237]